MDEKYEIEVTCDNCDKESKIKICKGASVWSLMKFFDSIHFRIKCRNCGCKYLRPKEGDC